MTLRTLVFALLLALLPLTHSTVAADDAAPAADPQPALVDLNTATAKALTALPSVGKVTAARIVAYREANGRFTAVDQLRNVTGIGPKTYDKIKDLVTVGPAETPTE